MNKKTMGATVIVICLVGIAYFVWNNLEDGAFRNLSLRGAASSKALCPSAFSPVMAAGPYYKGELLDAHLHLPVVSKAVAEIGAEIGQPCPVWDDALSLPYLHCLFGREGTTRAYGFHLLTKYSVTTEVKRAKEIEEQYPGMIVHFLMPAMFGPAINPDVSAIRKALENNPGLFHGMGELKMYDGKSPDDPYVLELLELAREYKLIVMMHPFNDHKAAVEKIVRQYSDVTFLFHGIDYIREKGDGGVRDNRNWLKKLIANNDNVYYSIDGGLPFFGWLERHMGIAVPKEESLPYAKSKFGFYLEQDIGRYKEMIEMYPNRFLRGTDRQFLPHYDKEVSALMEEYSRAFIARLAPSVQERFAHTNAEKLLEMR
ncbi:MAG: hypothetical protein Q8R25_01140 [bacterium]|nr:hypothetical protein [bacterium]